MDSKMKIAAFFLAVSSLGPAYAADFSGAYQDPAAPLSYVLIIQKGDVAVLTGNSIIADDAAPGSSNSVGWGVGTVSGNVIDIPEFHDNFSYCINHHVYTFSADGNTISKQITSSTPTARGISANFNCASNVGQTGTRVKIF
jgi:hypothetical protein